MFKIIKKALATGASIVLGSVPTLIFPMVTRATAADCKGNQIWDPVSQTCTAVGAYNTDIYVTIGNIINIGLGLLGLVALVLFLYAGFQWMTAGGKDDKIKSAKTLMKNAFIGIMIIILAAVLSNFVMGLLRGAKLIT